MAEKLFSVNEAAAQLGIKPKTLYSRINKGDVPVKRLFNWTIRLTEKDIQEIMTGTKAKGGAACE